MNFLKSLGSSLVGASAMGGLPFSMDTPSFDGNVAGAGGAPGESVVFEGLPDFVLHTGRSKADASLAVSIFKSRQPAAQLSQNALRRVKTLRHPNILAFLDGAELPNGGPVLFVTERVMPLSEYLTALRMEYGDSSDEFQMSVSWGLRSVLQALHFINVDCKLLHGRITPQSIFVTKGGDWKLGGFELTGEMTADGPSYIYTAFEQYSDANYRAPECQRREWKAMATGPVYASDIYGFACLMYYVFNGQISSTDLASATNIPPAIRTHYRKAIDPQPARRPSPQKMLGSSYFDTPFIKRMEFLENLAVKTPEEKVEYYKELCANLNSLPRSFGVHKVLPALKAVVEFGAATGGKNGPVRLDPSASHMLPAMVQIGGSLSPEEFKEQVLPIIVKLFSCNDRAVRVQLLQMMEKFTVHFDAKLVNSSVIFDNICSGFTDSAPVLRELTVKSMLHVADKLSDSNLNNRVMKYFAKLQSDPEPAIRTNTTICLGKIAGKLNATTRPKVLFPAFSRALRDPFPHARLAGLRSLTACEEYFSVQGMAGSIIPAISPLLLDVSISVREQASVSMSIFMKRVTDEAAEMKIREEAQAREQELKRESGVEVEHGGDTTATTVAAPATTAHSSGGYASSLTAWATSAVASNVGKIVGGGSSSSSSASIANAPASRTTPPPSSSGLGLSANGGFQSSGSEFGTSSRTSSNSGFATFAANDDFAAADDEWGNDDDLDGLASPKQTTSSSFSASGGSLSVNRSGASTSSGSLSVNRSGALSSFSSSSGMKLSVSRAAPSSAAAPSASLDLNTTSNEWGDDNWGNDDKDLDFGASTAPTKTSSFSTGSTGFGSTSAVSGIGGLRVPAVSSSSSLSSSTTSSVSTASATAHPPRKTLAERRAEAKAKREPLGAMKLEAPAAAKKGDEWDNWDF